MRLKQVTIQGFRGFNEPRTIVFNDRLTLIFAPNSYGKTSISEALEWLLYGVTSRVERADSKDEYRDCYRNRHLSDSESAFVEATFVSKGADVMCKAELQLDNTARLALNGSPVAAWPHLSAFPKAQKPFILQHALKYLLLASPGDRFTQFAALLGLEELDKLQSDFASFCTKPDVHLPTEARTLMQTVAALLARLMAQASLARVSKAFKKGLPGVDAAYSEIKTQCLSRLPSGTPDASVLPMLLRMREDAAKKLFDGKVSLQSFTDAESAALKDSEAALLSSVTDDFIREYLSLAGLSTVSGILDRAQFLDIGARLLVSTPDVCPFCGQTLDGPRKAEIDADRQDCCTRQHAASALHAKKTELLSRLRQIEQTSRHHLAAHTSKCGTFTVNDAQLAKLKDLFGEKQLTLSERVASAVSALQACRNRLTETDASVQNVCKTALDGMAADRYASEDLKAIGTALVAAAGVCGDVRSTLALLAGPLGEAQAVLQHQLDQLAGTEDVAVLIELIEKRQDIERDLRLRAILDGVKDLRRLVDQAVGQTILDSINSGLTADVMDWYKRIRTTGDPDVHFAGFDMERTVKGELKARRVSVKAQSYGKDLASAVSSLSESKLNALGLCVSIASNLKGGSPYQFLLIDDPIQSWDADHETQFIEVLRTLVDQRGKQVVLLSHNQQWLKKVREGLRSQNGSYYEITGYDARGPHIACLPWAKVEDRLAVVDAILKDPTATSIRLQQAEQEIRILVCELAASLFETVKGQRKNPNDLNATKVRNFLTECGVDSGLVDRIGQTFATTDDAHHAAPGYAPNRERLRQYHGYIGELRCVLRDHRGKK